MESAIACDEIDEDGNEKGGRATFERGIELDLLSHAPSIRHLLLSRYINTLRFLL